MKGIIKAFILVTNFHAFTVKIYFVNIITIKIKVAIINIIYFILHDVNHIILTELTRPKKGKEK